MKRYLSALLILLFMPLGIIGYVCGLAWIMLWIGWQEADEFMTAECNRRKANRATDGETNA